MRKFPAEVVNYQIANKPDGVVAIIKLVVPTSEIDKSYFIGGLVNKFATFNVDDVQSISDKPEEILE